MPHCNNINYSLIIVDCIDYPVIANTEAPQVFSSLNFAATFRTRGLGQTFNLWKYPVY